MLIVFAVALNFMACSTQNLDYTSDVQSSGEKTSKVENSSTVENTNSETNEDVDKANDNKSSERSNSSNNSVKNSNSSNKQNSTNESNKQNNSSTKNDESTPTQPSQAFLDDCGLTLEQSQAIVEAAKTCKHCGQPIGGAHHRYGIDIACYDCGEMAKANTCHFCK